MRSSSHDKRHASLVLALIFTLFLSLPSTADWRDDWEVEHPFRIDVDTTGYALPVDIAFVPEPGPGSDAPLYYVLELRGRIRVVTRDRTVRTFAEGFTAFEPLAELPHRSGEAGAAGLGLDPATGGVFVTMVHRRQDGTLGNRIMKFSTRSGTFALEPDSAEILEGIFGTDPSSISHQIGQCKVHDGVLYVSVGDAETPRLARDMNVTNGKVLRIGLDGSPLDDNPFHRVSDPAGEANRVRGRTWALGFRNPFGMTFARGRLFVTDNGPSVDRLVEVQRGGDYLYDGSDWSIGARANAVWSPSVSPVSLVYVPEGAVGVPTSHQDRIFVAFSGGPMDPPGPGRSGQRSIVTFPYDFEGRHLAGPPRHFLRYRGDGRQLLVSLALGPDGLYFAPLMPGQDGESFVYRVHSDPNRPHPHAVSSMTTLYRYPELLLWRRGCTGCHSWTQEEEKSGPSLYGPDLISRLSRRLGSDAYWQQLEELDRRDHPHRSFRDRLRAAPENVRPRLWTSLHLVQPRFDDPTARMPPMDMSEEEADILSRYLLRQHRALSPDTPRIGNRPAPPR